MSKRDRYLAFLDIGHGNASVIRDGDSVVIIDCGSRGSGLIEFLKEEGISIIEYVIISHADQDHIGGLLAILSSREFTIKNLKLNADSIKTSAIWDDLAHEINSLSLSGQINFMLGITRSAPTIQCGSVIIETVGPTAYLATKGAGSTTKEGRVITSNSISASFHIKWKSRSIALLAGDMDALNLDALISSKANLEAEILIYPHHGGNNGHHSVSKFAEMLCDQVKPQTVFFSIGRNRFKNPRPEVVETIRKKLNNVRISCSQLSVNCSKTLHKVTPTHLTNHYAHGRNSNICCGGTQLVELTEEPIHYPLSAPHQAFIDSVTTTAMCRIPIT